MPKPVEVILERLSYVGACPHRLPEYILTLNPGTGLIQRIFACNKGVPQVVKTLNNPTLIGYLPIELVIT